MTWEELIEKLKTEGILEREEFKCLLGEMTSDDKEFLNKEQFFD